MLLNRASAWDQAHAGLQGPRAHNKVPQSIDEHSVTSTLIKEQKFATPSHNILVCKEALALTTPRWAEGDGKIVDNMLKLPFEGERVYTAARNVDYQCR